MGGGAKKRSHGIVKKTSRTLITPSSSRLLHVRVVVTRIGRVRLKSNRGFVFFFPYFPCNKLELWYFDPVSFSRNRRCGELQALCVNCQTTRGTLNFAELCITPRRDAVKFSEKGEFWRVPFLLGRMTLLF